MVIEAKGRRKYEKNNKVTIESQKLFVKQLPLPQFSHLPSDLIDTNYPTMTSSFSASARIQNWKYDVFLSFRDEDTRNNFISHFHAALSRKSIRTFIDDELRRGDEITRSLLKKIEESKIAVVIFSRNYASSTYCLDELEKIIECHECYGQTVIPIFFNVNPSDLLEPDTGIFAEARKRYYGKVEQSARMEEMVEGFCDWKRSEQDQEKLDKVQRWKVALKKAGNLSWHDLQINRRESELVDKIVNDVWKRVKQVSPIVSDFLVGVDLQIERIKSLLLVGLSDVRVLGIWGMGSIGKTTLAGAVFKQIAFQFEGCCFLSNIGKESQKCGGLTRLGEELLSKVLKEREVKLNTPDIRSSHFKEMLRHNRVLIVLDDVNNIEQLEYFAGDPCWFGSGSRVFVTSRDKQLLSITVDVTYEVKELNYEDALHLICWNAFKQKSPLEDFVALTHLVVRYARGNPLALKVLGSMLYGKSKTEWGSALKKLTRAPHKDIQDILKFTYDNLDDEERDIFLHIACLFESEDRDRVTQALDGCGFSADIGISILVDKSLLTISKNKLKMHDLLQEMGREIVRQESKRPSECNRLWNPDDIYKVLEENTGTEAIVGILLGMSEARKSELNRNAFTRISNLKFLILRMSINCGGFEEECKVQFPEGLESLPQQLRYLYWHGYPLKFLPANFHPTNLIELNFPYSRLEGLWEGDKERLERPFPATGMVALFLRACDDLPCTGFLPVQLAVHFNMFSSFMKHMVRCNVTGGLVITMHRHRSVDFNLHIFEDLLDPDEFARCHCTTDLATTFCFLLFHVTKFPPTETQKPVVDFLSLLPAQSASENPTIELKLLFFIHIPCPGVPFRSSDSEVSLEIWGSIVLVSSDMTKWSVVCHSSIFSASSSVGSSGLDYIGQSVIGLRHDEFPKRNSENVVFVCLIDISQPALHRLSACAMSEAMLSLFPLLTVPSSIGQLTKLTFMSLRYSKNIRSFPTTIDLQSLETLDLSGCSNLMMFPEVSRNIRYLYLNETAIQEVPLSIEHLSKLVVLDMKYCNELECIPSTIFKLKSLGVLILSGCKKLESFPEILETTNHLQHLSLDETAMVNLPDTFCNLKALNMLNFSDCSKLGKLPKNMKNLKSLAELRAGGCNLSTLPADLKYLSSIVELNLSGSNFDTMPAGINQLSKLRWINVTGCKRLQSLPELPPRIRYLNARDCRSLVSISGLKQLFELGCSNSLDDETFVFTNCFKLDQDNWADILASAQLKIQHFAMVRKHYDRELYDETFICFTYPGTETPEWFADKSMGSSVTIQHFPPDWLNHRFLGFAVCLVVAFDDRFLCEYPRGIVACKCNFQNSYGGCNNHIFTLNSWKYFPAKSYGSKHVFMWYDCRWYGTIVAKSNWLNECCWCNEISFEFSAEILDYNNNENGHQVENANFPEVEKCGVLLLYSKDEESNQMELMPAEVTKKRSGNSAEEKEEPHLKKMKELKGFPVQSSYMEE
ncbi:disease resistance-like protein DSC1 [Ricinus communis]|uniref:disease resistance-like protein DSC1 n=1 Tax=Ricinus communis TaxID=3988 RepID=UPI00201A3D75|nr:disease resistance-like protein DSC1 [Ricinus communis]